MMEVRLGTQTESVTWALVNFHALFAEAVEVWSGDFGLCSTEGLDVSITQGRRRG